MSKIGTAQDFPSTQPFYNILNDFVNLRRTAAASYATKHSDKKEVEILREVITASVDQRSIPEKKKIANRELKEYLEKENLEQIIIREGLRIRAEKYTQNLMKENFVEKESKLDITVSSKEQSSKYLLKAETNISCTLQKAIEVFNNWNWLNVLKLEKVEKIHSNNQKDFYFVIKFPLPFSQRDFMVSRWNEIEPKKFRSVIFSITRPDRPPIKKKARADVLATCIIESLEEKDKLAFKLFVQVDLKLKLSMLSGSLKGFYKMIKNMKELMEKKDE